MTPEVVDPDTTPAQASRAAVRAAGGHGLGRQQVLDAAVAFIDERGFQELSMRRLGAYLGVDAMALYRYVPSKEILLDGIVELVIDELYSDPDVHMSTSPRDWQDYLRRLAHGVRRIALAHPQVFPLVATRPPAAPWVRPPLRSLRWMESFLQTLLDQGFSDPNAVAVYRAFSSFLLGHLLLEVSGLGVDIGPVDEPDPDQAAGQDLSEYPHLLRLQSELSQDHSATEFEQSLDNLLDRLALLATP